MEWEVASYMGECGLKLISLGVHIRYFRSLPIWGVWIEMIRLVDETKN